MMRTILAPAVLAGLLALLTASQVHAYGAASKNTFLYNPNTGKTADVQQTAGFGPNGAYKNTSVSGSGPNGSFSGSSSKAYSPSMYGGYSGAGQVNYSGSASVNRAYYP